MRIVKSIENLSDIEKKVSYFSNIRPVLNRRALFSDATKEYRDPPEPEPDSEVTIRFRTFRYNVDAVILVVDGKRVAMTKAVKDVQFDYYEAVIQVGIDRCEYYFEIHSGRTICYYNQIGLIKELNTYYNFWIMPGFSTPDWAKGSVMYQIFADRFCNGDESNDVLDREYAYIGSHSKRVTDFNKLPDAMDVRSFYGGDLQGVWDKLDYLESLGIEVIYFNPLFVSPSNHKYDTQDYDYIVPHFAVLIEDEGDLLNEGDLDNTHAGRYVCRVTSKKNLEASNEFFARLVEEIHRRGMKVIMDGVFNHCGSFNKWLDREGIYGASREGYAPGAYKTWDSPYHNFFKFFGDAWPDNEAYDGWWGHPTLPKLNYEGSKELEDYIIGIGKKWVLPPYNMDGWRLDVAADLGYTREYNHKFWKRFRQEVKAAKPDALILAENYGDSNEWLQGDEWDTIMNYDAFMEPVTWFLTGMQKHSDEYIHDKLGNPDYFFGSMHHNMARMGGQSVAIAMNELSNHDHSRFLTRTNRTVGRTNSRGPHAANMGINKAVFKEAVVIQMTWPGAPTVYYGDEAGLCGWTDPDNRRGYPWSHEDSELVEFHRAAIAMHKNNEVLKTGSYKALYGEYNIIAYGRFNRKDSVVVIVNNNDIEKRVLIPVWEIGVNDNNDMEQIFASYRGGFDTHNHWYSVSNGYLDIGLRGESAVVLRKI